jgi:hypothetical protein
MNSPSRRAAARFAGRARLWPTRAWHRPTTAAVLALACLASTPLFAHEPTEAAKQRMLDGGYLDFIWIGAEHMLTGYDHLLFLLGVLFFLRRPVDILKFVTAFTLGHTVTLLFGTLAGLRVNHYAIDAVIALTVIYKAVENLDGFRRGLGMKAPPMLPMVFAFGLIHGLGLSTRLQDMTLVHDDDLVGRILTFNVGVELGQVAALAVMGAVLSVWRSTPGWTRFSTWSNAALIVAGIVLFAIQGYGFLNQPSDAGPAALTRAASLLALPRT